MGKEKTTTEREKKPLTAAEVTDALSKALASLGYSEHSKIDVPTQAKRKELEARVAQLRSEYDEARLAADQAEAAAETARVDAEAAYEAEQRRLEDDAPALAQELRQTRLARRRAVEAQLEAQSAYVRGLHETLGLPKPDESVPVLLSDGEVRALEDRVSSWNPALTALRVRSDQAAARAEEASTTHRELFTAVVRDGHAALGQRWDALRAATLATFQVPSASNALFASLDASRELDDARRAYVGGFLQVYVKLSRILGPAAERQAEQAARSAEPGAAQSPADALLRQWPADRSWSVSIERRKPAEFRPSEGSFQRATQRAREGAVRVHVTGTWHPSGNAGYVQLAFREELPAASQWSVGAHNFPGQRRDGWSVSWSGATPDDWLVSDGVQQWAVEMDGPWTARRVSAPALVGERLPPDQEREVLTRLGCSGPVSHRNSR